VHGVTFHRTVHIYSLLFCSLSHNAMFQKPNTQIPYYNAVNLFLVSRTHSCATVATIKPVPCLAFGFTDLEIKSDYICHEFYRNTQRACTKLR